MGRYSFGQPVRRLEDHRFITGSGRYAEDIMPDNACHTVFFRSPVAHANIGNLDISAAAAAPGVLAIYTGDDVVAHKLKGLPIRSSFTSRDGSGIQHPYYPALAVDRVRHVGQCIAAVVAETRAQAEDAADMIHCEFGDLPVVTDGIAAARNGAVQLHAEIPGNLCYDWENGNQKATLAAIDNAEHIIEYSMYNSRVVISPMENRGCVVSTEPETGIIKLEGAVQNVFTFRSLLAGVFGEEDSRFHISAPDVGGGFGAKNQLHPEHVMLVHAHRQLGRPVRWTNTRSETFVSDSHGRHVHHNCRLGLDSDYRMVGLQVETIADMGAYLSTNGPMISTAATAAVLGGPYEIPTSCMNVRGYFSNTTPTDAYRGAGRPEANFITERLIEVAARQLGIDAMELRRRNLIQNASLPYTNAMDKRIDSGAFPAVFERALAMGTAGDFEERRRQSAANGKLRGFGVASYLESTLGGPVDNARIQFEPDGPVTLTVGTQSNGQSHETVFSQLVADRLGIDIERIRFTQADTASPVPGGGGHGGSRSLQIAGSAIHFAAENIIEKGKRIAAEKLETAIADIDFNTDDGAFVVKGTDRRITIDAVAREAASGTGLEADETNELNELVTYEREHFTYPNGCHTIEIEIDRQTGVVTVEDYKVVDDFGKIVNPLVVEGQVVGGIIQGLGQAILEHTVYDETGQLTSGTFMDYCLPRADDFTGAVEIEFFEDAPPATNPLGIKGCGEAGCVGSTAAMVNAITNALESAGIKNADAIEMPITPDKLWRVLDSGSV